MTSERKYQIRHSLYLLLTAVIWGVAFVAQSVGMEHVGPFTFNAARFFLGTFTLLPFILIRSGRGKKRIAEHRFSGREDGFDAEFQYRGREEVTGRSLLLKAGLLCGTALAVASNLQQIGIKYTTVGKAGFLTAMYIVLVPILGIFVGRKAGGKVWLAVLTAVAGLYFLCLAGGEMQFQFGEKATITLEMERIVKGLENHIPLEKLLRDFALRWQIEEISEFAEVFSIARRSGGNLPEILERTASVIRDRMEIDTEIDILLSSRKYEQKIMEGIPFFIIFYLGLSSDGFFDVLYHNPAGVLFMTGCLAAYLAAVLLSDRIMAIEL